MMKEKYKNHWDSGAYVCSTCGNPLFRSDDKFDSWTAWPSFRKSMKNAVETKDDFSHNMHRSELLCGKCKQHLGHVFDDGKICGDTHPEADMRYCILSDVLKFDKGLQMQKEGDKMNPGIEARHSAIGRGVFAKRNFEKGETIIELEGKRYTYDELPVPYDSVDDHYLQIGKDLYIGPSKAVDDFFNHSCDPNTGVVINGRTITLVAIKRIRKDEEITFDYSTTMDEDDWEMDCLCGSMHCRKRIRDFKYLPQKIQEKYVALGIVPNYAIESMTQKQK